MNKKEAEYLIKKIEKALLIIGRERVFPKPFAFITQESMERLSRGGNCRGSVPIHISESVTAKIPLFTKEQMIEYADQLLKLRSATLGE